jgi:SOS-response transcriptional repressor LexA
MTEAQSNIYKIIDSWWIKHGFAPSMQNIMELSGHKSKSSIHKMVVRLCELGYCKKLPHKARSVKPTYLKIRNESQKDY